MEHLSYDMLFECVKECNLYPAENPMDLVTELALKISNISLEGYEVKFKLDGKEYDLEDFTDVLGERVADGVTYTVNLEEENVSRSLGVNNFGDTVVSNNWMFFGFEANVDREGDLREDSTHMNFQLKLNKPLAEALLDDEFTGTVEVTEFNSNVYGWVTVDTLEKVLNLYPELNKIKLVYRKKS